MKNIFFVWKNLILKIAPICCLFCHLLANFFLAAVDTLSKSIRGARARNFLLFPTPDQSWHCLQSCLTHSCHINPLLIAAAITAPLLPYSLLLNSWVPYPTQPYPTQNWKNLLVISHSCDHMSPATCLLIRDLWSARCSISPGVNVNPLPCPTIYHPPTSLAKPKLIMEKNPQKVFLGLLHSQ